MKNILKKIGFISLVLFSFLIGSTYILINFLYFRGPIINLKGLNEETININSKYKEAGYDSHYLFYDMTDEVNTINGVKTDKIGDYKIVYKLKYKNKNYTQIRNIHVRDTEPPTIILNDNSYACPNGEFVETGYEIKDNYDKELKDKIKIKKEKDKWIYSIKDNSGNKTTVERKITYKDVEKPKIELTNPTYSIYINSIYSDPGYKITDNCSQDLNNKVKISGEVNTSQLGKYTISYEVTDESGNNTKVERTVNVVNQPVFINKTVYLTFDDGPSSNITPQILDILREEGAKATFFINDKGRGLDYIIKRASDEGHTVASHTATHNFYSVYSSETAFFNEIESVHNLIYNVTGKSNRIFRFPGGSSNLISRYNPGIMTRLVNEANNRGYLYYDWTIDSNDAGGANTKEQVYYNVVNYMGYRSLNIVLMHDAGNKYATLGALRDIIRYGKSNGFTFLPITDTTPQAKHHVNN